MHICGTRGRWVKTQSRVTHVLVQIIACHLFSTKPLSKPLLMNWWLGPLEKHFSEIWIENLTYSLKTNLIIKKNVFENVNRKMSAIMSQPQCLQIRFFVYQENFYTYSMKSSIFILKHPQESFCHLSIPHMLAVISRNVSSEHTFGWWLLSPRPESATGVEYRGQGGDRLGKLDCYTVLAWWLLDW